MLTIEQVRALSNVDPEFAKIARNRPALLKGWTRNTNIPQVRKIMAMMRQQELALGGGAKPKSAPPYVEEDIRIPGRDGTQLNVRVHRPRELPAAGCPGFVFFHGGGFCVGDANLGDWLCRIFTELGGVAVNVEYRLAPENVFPKAAEDAIDALKWVSENAEKLTIKVDKGFIVGGESAGAELSLAAAHVYVYEMGNSPPLTGVYAAIPPGVDEDTVPEKYKGYYMSMEQNADAPMLSAESVDFIWDSYKPQKKHPLAFPIMFPDHSKLPKTYFQACGMDPIRDCAIVMEMVWRDAGVPTKIDLYPGLPHGFWAFFADLPFGQRHKQDSRKALEWLLESPR